MNQKEMLLVLPVPFRIKANELLMEAQACHGLEQWAENFESVIVAAPVIPEQLAQQNKTITWLNTDIIFRSKQIELIPLPWAYSLLDFTSYYSSVRAQLKALISRSRYLQFAIGGLVGDWAAIAALEAHKQGRAYAIHTDRVEYEIIAQVAKGSSLKERLKAKIIAPLLAEYQRKIIRDCTLGLWQSEDCYSAYSPYCQNSFLVHDIHTKAEDRISEIALNKKIETAKTDSTVRICYAGRIDPMKAPLDWVQAIGKARDLGVNLQATWIGDGPLMDKMKATITNLGLDAQIELTGWEENRDRVLQRIKESHFMLFTHVTPEAARCLIESLICGTPIVGYYTKHSEHLVKDFGGGVFAPMNDWQKLGEIIANLATNRQELAHLIAEAGENGSRFTDIEVFRYRSDLIKKYLS